ncbi:leucyl aminopeptidase [Amylibacter kogurei]|uniref:Leucyl aminopeptidase n=1 Tax=Paramylibacter kogurei TaxID=1889778 RepID=A0A2G5K165_9RHOB|nr:leucyl aminopeptidase family protein [Amylibacter kogurei]PIB23288.1 leucyl aminopeptidase [Amylibacter kogurei]
MINTPPSFAPTKGAAIPVHVLETDALADWLESADARVSAWVAASEFTAALGQVLLVPNEHGAIDFVLAGWGNDRARARGRFHMAVVARKLPKGIYEIVSGLDEKEHAESALAWLLSAYAFDRYTSKKGAVALLRPHKSVDQETILAQAAGDFLTRDLINTPTNDMGPDALEDAFLDLAKSFNAKTTVIKGDDLIAQNFPMIHAVGRASDQAPRLLDMIWGDAKHPKITLVGKGVCFDTGGLNIKPGASMGLMKKDMGGSATVMGLAHMIMAMKLPVRLRVLVPAVENSISAGAFRPQDILTSRKGMTVEINNTDAEGRLVLADALALADEEKPELLVCTATLTGAARVALGPDVPPYFTDDEKLAKQIFKSAERVADPLWRLPFWDPYEPMIEPDVADLDNAPAGGFGGAITAALFLRRFVEHADSFVHLDVYGWTPSAKPARSKGGACQSARAMFDVIAKRYG